MGCVNITIGALTFDRANYDAESDVLYHHLGDPRAGEGRRPARATSCAMRLGRAR